MSFQDILESVIFLIIPVAILGFYFPQKFAEYAGGAKIGRTPILILGGIVALIYFAILFLPLYQFINPSIPQLKSNISVSFLAPTIMFINLIIRQVREKFRLKNEEIILDLGRGNKNQFVLIAIFIALNVLNVVKTISTRNQVELELILGIGFFHLLVIVFLVVSYFSRIYIAQDGILYALFRLKWEQLKGYKWGEPKENKIPLTIKGRGEINVTVPIDQQEEIEAIFQERQIKQLEPLQSKWTAKELPPYEIEYQRKKKAIQAARPKTPIAPLDRRLGALLIDAAIILLPIYFIVIFLFWDWAYVLGPYGRLFTYAIIIGYLGYYNSDKKKGQTIGQRMLNIAVVDTNYRYLSLPRSLLRAFLFCLIFLLFQWGLPLLNEQVTLTIVRSIIAGTLPAMLYAYLFNNDTRQGIHELLVGSYVVKWPPITEAPLPQTPRAHRIFTYGLFILGFLLFSGGSFVISSFNAEFRAETVNGFQTLETALEKEEGVFSVHVSEKPIRFNESASLGGTLTIDIWTKKNCYENFEYCDQLEEQAARTALEELGFIGRYSEMEIIIDNRFDIGVTLFEGGQSSSASIANWRQELGE